jgi:hypothetical protein
LEQVLVAVQNILNNSLNFAEDEGYKIGQNFVLDAKFRKICPMGAVIILTNRMDSLPRSFVVGFMQGFDRVSPNNKWATNPKLHAIGYECGRKFYATGTVVG